MRAPLVLAFALVSLASACGVVPISPDAGPADAGVEVDARTPLVLCTEPDRVCPEIRAFPGAPCVGELSCTWTRYEGRCVDGAWVLTPTCDDGVCGSPILSESCPTPFEGSLDGARVVIGPPDEDRPYADDERVAPVWGPQGYPMVPYAIRIEGAASPPDCIGLDQRVRNGDAVLGMRATRRLHCGMSRLAYALVPLPYPCPPGEHPVDLTVTVDGIGAATAHLRLLGGTCPPGTL